MRITVLVLLIFSLASCWAEEIRFEDLVGQWRTREGYSVLISRDGTYRFCDQDDCFTGRYSRPGAHNSIAVHLKGLFSNPKAERFALHIERMMGRDMMYPDLDFSPTGGNDPPGWCEGKPCVLIGSFESRDHIIFFRTRDLE